MAILTIGILSGDALNCAKHENENKKLWYINRREIQFASNIKAKYNLSIDRYNEILDSQHSLCAICKKPLVKGIRGISVDHDHACCPGRGSCGKCIRGLVHLKCNFMIAAFEDEDFVKLAIEYLNKFKANGCQTN